MREQVQPQVRVGGVDRRGGQVVDDRTDDGACHPAYLIAALQRDKLGRRVASGRRPLRSELGRRKPGVEDPVPHSTVARPNPHAPPAAIRPGSLSIEMPQPSR